MSKMMTFDRSSMMAGAVMGGSTMPAMSAMSPLMGNMCMVPRCTMKMEKCQGGMKLTCSCEDEVACAMLQNLCDSLAGTMCSCCCLMNGMLMCQCNFAMCKCECEHTENGVCITCTSGDKGCCDMVQACCDCITKCMQAGCMACVCFNNMPICCCSC